MKKLKYTFGNIIFEDEASGLVDYVKGPEPDRWHWNKECKQYPRVAVRTRSNRPSSDLCDECQDIERTQLHKTART